MKTLNRFRALLIVIVILVAAGSCKKDESFTQVSAFEKSIHDSINLHRKSLNLSPMKLEFLMMDNAKSCSERMSKGISFEATGINDEMAVLATNLKGDSYSVWVTTCHYERADSVMNIIRRNQEILTTIEGNYSHSAVGAVKSTDGTYFITNLLMHIP